MDDQTHSRHRFLINDRHKVLTGFPGYHISTGKRRLDLSSPELDRSYLLHYACSCYHTDIRKAFVLALLVPYLIPGGDQGIDILHTHTVLGSLIFTRGKVESGLHQSLANMGNITQRRKGTVGYGRGRPVDGMETGLSLHKGPTPDNNRVEKQNGNAR